MQQKRNTNLQKIAIFDIDGTIFRSSLLIELVEALIEDGLFRPSMRAQYDQQKTRWLDRKGDYSAYIEAVVRVFTENIKGLSYDDCRRVASLVVKRYRHRTYRFTETLIRDLKEKNYYLLAISYSPKWILDLFCGKLGFNKVYGTYYEIDQTNYFTGKIRDQYLNMNKANILESVIQENKLTLKNSIGVGDTESDIPFLKIVTNPICFNPNKKLYNYAKRANWKIVVERKDVIHEL
jgi:HAD superfamily hydrolase (TIGR01490 family)